MIIIRDSLSSQQSEHFSTDLSCPSDRRETIPIATWANFNGLPRLILGMNLRTKDSRSPTCSNILCLSAMMSGFSSVSSCVIYKKVIILRRTRCIITIFDSCPLIFHNKLDKITDSNYLQWKTQCNKICPR